MIGGFSHMFATMFGNAFLTQAVKTGGSKLVKAFSKRAYKALVRIEKAELAGPGANKVTKQIQSTAITRASKTHTNFMKEIRGFKRRIDNSITGAVPKQLNSLLGKVFHTGGPRKAFTTHAKEFAINEIITMPIMYSMYKNDKNNYPEMKNQSFLNYYSSTLPFSIGFMGATASSKLFQRKLSGNLINKLKNNPNAVRRTIHVAGMIGAAGTKAFSRIGNITQEIKKEAFSNRPVGDLFTISGAKDFQQRLSTAAGTGYRKAESYIGNDSDSIIHTTKLAVEKLSHSSRPQATEILSKNFNSMVGREGKIMSFVNKLLPNENKIQRNVIESNDKSFNHLLQDRGVWQFENKVYDTKAFHLGKIRDLAAESLDKFNVGIGSARVHPFKVISYGLNFLKTDFNRNLNSTLSGTKTTSIGSTYFAQIARNAEKEFTSDMTEEEKLKKYFSTLVKGPNVSQKDNESLTTAYVDSFKRGHEDVEQVYQGLNNNFSRGFLGINENSLFYIDKNKTGNIILGNGKNVTLHNTSFAFGTTDNKSTIASSINRMLGVTRTSGGDIIAGKDRSRLLTREELIKERKQHGYKDDELLTAFDDTMLKWEIGGGGTTSVGNVLSGWFKKYTSHEWSGNMFNKDYTKAIRAGTPENKRFYIDNVSTNITKAQDNIFDIITSKGSKWSDFIDSFNAEGFSVRGEGGKRLSISDLSLNGVTNKDTALDKLHNMLGFAKAHKQDSLVHMLNTMRKKISTEQASDVQTVLSELNPSGIPISKNYEAILLQTFTASAKNTEKTSILDTVFDTAKSLNPDSSVDFNSPINLLSINKHTQSIKRSLHNITKFNEKSNQLLDNIIKENNIYQQTIEQVEGKWGIHMHSTQNMNTKFVKPTDDTLYLVPDTGGFFPSFTKPDTIGNSFLKNSIGSSGHIVMGSLETFNKAMGTMGLGIDNYRSSTEFLTNYFKKRILPIGGIIGGMDILDRVTDQNPLFNNTPLQDGVYQVGANAYAGVRLASAGIMDSLGVTTAAKYMEDLLPGSINSPLSGAVRGVLPPLAGAMLGFSKFGPVGGLTGGIIGSAVSAITAGGPLAAFDDWNISKDRAQVLAELKGEALINVKRGRFWEMGSGHFWGTQTNYFRPHMFALMKADYKDSPNFKTSIFDEIASYVDPSAYNRRHYFSRPSPEHPGILSNIPIIGSIIGMPNTSQHQDVLNMEQMTQDRYGYRKSVLNNNYLGQDNDEFGEVSDYQKIGRASGLGASQEHINNFYSEPISGSSIDSRLSSAFYNIKEVAGLRGFLTEQVQEQITGNQQLFAEKPRIEANNIGSLNRQFWDLNLGGMGGLCIAEDMLIKTDNGKKEIQYINIGELVFTNKGYYKVIGKTNRSLFENETILKINTEINSNIECTKNHIIPILRKVNNKANCFTDCFKIFEIPAEEIKLGDYLCYPVNKTQKLKNKIANMNKYMFFENCFLIKVTEITELESTKQFYDLEIESYHYFTVNGILVHNSEGIRRIFSRKTSDISYWNPIRNTAPKWLPGNEYYVDIQHGDPYSKIEMGEARLPGESYRTLYDVKISPAGEGQLLGVSEQEALNYYAGNLETVVPRFNAEDQITKRKNEIINELKGMGSLVKEQSIAIDIKRDITAESDGTIKLDNGEIVPVAFAPLVKGKFLSGSTSGLNAFLALSGKSKGMLIGIDSQTGETSEAIIQANVEKYKEEAGKDYEIRQRAIQHMERLQSEGVPVSEGIAYSHLDRLRILGDVAYYSNNFKNELRIVKEQSKAGLLSPAEEAQVDVILEEVDAKKQKFLFKNRRFTNTGIALTREGQLEQEAVDNKYNFVEKGIGAAWEGLTYLRNPITSRFIGNRDALQAYEEDVVYGQEFKKWQTPIDSYVNPFFNKMAQENNPIQGGLSGATAGLIFGGPMGSAMGAIAGSVYSATVGQVVHNSGWVPDEVKKQRQILMAADIAEHQRYKELYDATSYNEYKFRMRNTITDSLESNQPLTIERIAKIANKPDKYYVRQILSGVTTDNINETRRLLAPEVATLMDKSLGVDTNTRGSDYAGGYNIDPDDISDYDRPIEDIVVKTFQREGLDHHRVGLGWNDTIRRMAMEERLSGPISAMNNSESPERNITARVNGSHISRQLKLILKEYNAQVSLENNNGPVNIIVEVI